MGWEILKLIFYLLIFVLVVWGAYYCSKRIAQYSTSYGGSKYMQIIDRMAVSKDTSLAIVKIGDKYLLVSMSSGGTELLREFTEEEFEVALDNEAYVNKIENPIGNVFQNIFGGNFLSQNEKKNSAKTSDKNRGFDFFGFMKKESENDGEILGRYDGDISDVENMDFSEILKRGMSGSDKRKVQNRAEIDKKDEPVDKILKSVDKRRKNFDSRKEEKDAATDDKK